MGTSTNSVLVLVYLIAIGTDSGTGTSTGTAMQVGHTYRHRFFGIQNEKMKQSHYYLVLAAVSKNV